LLGLSIGCSASAVDPVGSNADATIPWFHAKSLMRDGHVTEAYQSQVKDREVFLQLIDGKLVMTREPRRGALVEFLTGCNCGVQLILN
jgi:hypothetical protein